MERDYDTNGWSQSYDQRADLDESIGRRHNQDSSTEHGLVEKGCFEVRHDKAQQHHDPHCRLPRLACSKLDKRLDQKLVI